MAIGDAKKDRTHPRNEVHICADDFLPNLNPFHKLSDFHYLDCGNLKSEYSIDLHAYSYLFASAPNFKSSVLVNVQYVIA